MDAMLNLSRTDGNATRLKNAPAATVVLDELVNAFNVPDPDLDYIVELITVEPALTAEVLKRSNTLAFAGKAPATDIFEAVTRIGMLETRNAVLSLTGSTRTASPTVSSSSRTGVRY